MTPAGSRPVSPHYGRRGPAKRTRRRLWLWAVPLVLLAAFLTWALWPEHFDPAQIPDVPVPHVRILRDTWGVPHIFGERDADTAFGLAYAHAEDDFTTIQQALLAARGTLAAAIGPQGAPNDYLVALLRIRESVAERYAADLDADTRAVCEGYAAGLNHYARLHPDEVLPGLFPAVGQDIAAGFVHKLPLFYGLHKTLAGLLGQPAPAATPPPGSNTFAVAPSRSADGHTRLAINSHQPWEGPVAWYEAHLHSEQGWNTYGGLFPGAPIVLLGFGEQQGWAHTVNRPDLVDVFKLEIDPAHPERYRFDGAWRELERRAAPITVRLLGRARWTVTREVLWSVFGPVVRGPGGTFAVRAAGLGDVRAVQQWYRMNRAQNLAQWQDAMRLMAIPMFNCGYADARGNLYFVYNALLPLRAPGHDWSQEVRGDSSDALWTEFLPFDRLPQVKNPPSGFFQNANSAPYRTTTGPGNPDAMAYSPAFGIETSMTNRALRLLELLGTDPSITAEEFVAYKYDRAYSTRSSPSRALRALLALPDPEDAQLRAARDLLRNWDLRTDPQNRAAALALSTLQPDDRDSIPDATVLNQRLGDAARQLRTHFGRIDPTLEEVQRLRRGSVDLGLGGGPDIVNAVYSRMVDGRRVGHAGDSLVLLVDWDAKGHVKAQAIQPYGTATTRPSSPHYTDQARLFVRGELRPVWFEEAEIRAHLEREYTP